MKTLPLLLLALAARGASQETPVEELAARVREDLHDVDTRLDEASAAEAPRDPLQSAQAAHVRAIADLEELIRHVEQHPGGN